MPLHGVERGGLGRIVGGKSIAQHDAPAGTAHPHHLGQRACRLQQVMERVAAADDVERALAEGQRVDVAPVPGDVAEPRPRRQLARLLQHRLRGVEPLRPAHPPGEGRNHRARPAGDVERDILGARARRLHQQIERGLVVMRRRSGKLHRLAGELVGNRGVVRRSGGGAAAGRSWLGHRCGPSGCGIMETAPSPHARVVAESSSLTRVGLPPYNPLEGTPLEHPAFDLSKNGWSGGCPASGVRGWPRSRSDRRRCQTLWV